MTDNWQTKGKQYGAFLRTIPKEELEKINKEARERAEAEHKEFQAAFKGGRCYLCGSELICFDEQQPCAHWLLNPHGFRKRHFPAVTEKYGFFKLQNYLRWVANEGGFAVNINDLKEEGSGKLIELTIRYDKIEWAFSCTKNDFNGHGSGKHQQPHYHFSMRDGARTLIRFNDFHVPLTEYDVVSLTAELENPDFIRRQFLGGEGMNDVMKENVLEHLIENASSIGNPEEADFEFQHILQADDGTTMRGDDIQALYQEAKERGVTLGSLLRQGRIPNAKVTTIVTPGPGVVEHNIRSGRGRTHQSER